MQIKARSQVSVPIFLEKKFYVHLFGNNKMIWMQHAVWPDLAKFRQFGTILNVFGHFEALFSILQPLKRTFASFFMHLGKVSLLWLVKDLNII